MKAKAADMPPASENKTMQELQQEIAVLRAELQALRSTTQLRAPHSISRAGNEQAFDFLKLPRELRNQIYEFCVVVGEVRVGDYKWLQRPDMRYNHPKGAKAEVSLFTVNKQIRLEALEGFLSKNHLVLPNAAMSPNGFRNGYARHIPGSPGRSLVRKYLRSISIPFDFRSVTEDCQGEYPTNFAPDDDTHAVDDWVMHVHDYFAFQLSQNSVWALTSIVIHFRQLRRLQINLQNATCRLGCHRLIVTIFNDNAMKANLESCISGETVERIQSLEFLGTISDEERRAIRSAFPQCIRSKITFWGQFDNDLLEWDPEVEVLDEPPNEHEALKSSLD